jgi:hypothetical protein
MLGAAGYMLGAAGYMLGAAGYMEVWLASIIRTDVILHPVPVLPCG